MTDPVTASVMVILGKYVIDRGADLAKEVGPAAANKAGELLKTALNRLRRTPKGEMVAGGFEEDPETYEKPVEKELAAAAAADPDFAARLQELLAQYEEAAKAHAATAGTSYQATLTGSGAIAQGPESTALGERAVQARDVQGPIITGSGNVIHTGRTSVSPVTLPPTLAPLRHKLARHFNRSALKGLCLDLGVAPDDLPGETRTELAQALVEHCHQRGRLPELIRRCREERPHVDYS